MAGTGSMTESCGGLRQVVAARILVFSTLHCPHTHHSCTFPPQQHLHKQPPISRVRTRPKRAKENEKSGIECTGDAQRTSNLIFFDAMAPSDEGVSSALAAFLFNPRSMTATLAFGTIELSRRSSD